MLAAFSRFQPAVPLLLRVVLGAIFIAHGLQKVSGDMHDFIRTVDHLGFPVPVLFAWAAALSEFLGGICVLVGLFTRWAALAIAIVMTVAVTKVHLHEGLILGYEYPLTLLAVAVAIMLTGAGPASLDKNVLHRDF
ncbi:MAG: DoxX family protein [Deltaproteobacteria bacterium]|nr:DoxX family protein [Deltaproteobacteria bacterium]